MQSSYRPGGGVLGRGRDLMPINIDLVSLNLYQGDVSNIRW
jgi:hypothetical protein